VVVELIILVTLILPRAISANMFLPVDTTSVNEWLAWSLRQRLRFPRRQPHEVFKAHILVEPTRPITARTPQLLHTAPSQICPTHRRPLLLDFWWTVEIESSSKSTTVVLRDSEHDKTDDRDGNRVGDCDGEALGSWRIHPGPVRCRCRGQAALSRWRE